MQAALILIEDNCRNHQADEQGTHNRCSQPCGRALQPLHLHAEDAVSHAISQGPDEQHLCECEDAERCSTVVSKKCRRDQAAQRPVDSESA